MTALGILAGVLIISAFWPALTGGAPYVGVPPQIARRMMRLASLQPGETLLDLGCGDGRVLRLAAQEFSAVGRGVEIDPLRVWWANLLNQRAGLPDGSVRRGNMFSADLSEAEVVFLFQCKEALSRLSPQLRSELRPGGRVVSYGFALPDWKPAAVDGNIYLYVSGRKR